MNIRLFVLVALLVAGCAPAVVGVSAALGGLAVGVTYEVAAPPCDAGADR